MAGESTELHALVKRAKLGDHEAFRALVEHYQSQVFNLALMTLGDQVMAQEVAQDVFVRLYHSLKDFRFSSAFETWLYKVVINLCRDHTKRKRRAARSLPLSVIDGSRHEVDMQWNPEEQLLHEETAQQVRAALSSVRPEWREALLLRYIAALSYGEIAEALGCSVGTVCSRISRGLKEVGKQLHHLCPDR